MTTYDIKEVSVDSGSPYYLYEFKRGEDVWRFSASEYNIQVGPDTFEPAPISHAAINQTGDIERVTLDITLPLSHPFAVEQRTPNITNVTTITIYRGHYGIATGNEQVMFKGRVVSFNISALTFNLVCENIQTSLRRAGLRGKYHRTCRHVLYGSGCKLDLDTFLTSATIVSISDDEVTVEEVEGKTDVADFYTGGILKFDEELYYVVKHTGTTLRLLYPPADITTESEITIAPGCNLARVTCLEKFNNVINFGGYPYIPNRNPFQGFVGGPI